MSSKSEKDRQKQIQDRCQTLLATMLRDEDNKYCVDCDAKGPRWASWNLGIFLCIRCAGIHRNLGVHISKVKSVNLDTWTPEQVVSLQQMGNSRARAVYEANLPDNFRRPQTDSSLEAFVRAKYEQKKYIAREWVPPPIPKVNWDKELEEEAQRQRRRKKEEKLQQNRKSNSSLTEVPVPQLLPKPKGSTSPKPGRTAVEPNKSQKSATQDLLGLDTPVGNPSSLSGAAVPNNGEDIFTSFLSAPPSSAPVAAEPSEGDAGKGRTAEEESFFNQPAPSSQEKRQLTKDSILALYSTGPTPQPAAAAAAPIYGIPGGIYTQQPAPANMAFSMPPAATIPNGMMAAQPLPGGVLQNGVFSGASQQPGAMPGIASNPFFNMGVTALAAPVQGFPTMTQLPQQMGRLNLGGPVIPTQPVLGVPAQAVPVSAMNLPVGSPALGMGSFPQQSNQGHTLATNLWQ
ncbi:stromal membrane-associated protein 1 isoform X1 [Anabrus simplex]|uniref:stromal membrane-associated protein 1 isoform X1 n=1 Tax=Anabrus simplex TaxID=316456 RepID=UPI0034DCCD5B